MAPYYTAQATMDHIHIVLMQRIIREESESSSFLTDPDLWQVFKG